MTVKSHASEENYGRGVLLVVLGAAFLSTGGLFIRFVESASDWHIVFYRSIVIFLAVLALVLFRHRRGTVRAFRDVGRAGLFAGVMLGAGNISYILAMRHTTVANALFIISSAPFFTAILGRLILGERVSRATWIAISCALGGIAVMMSEDLAGGRLLGNLMSLAAALTFAGTVIAWRLGKHADMTPTIVIAAVTSGLIGAALVPDWSISGHDLAVCAAMGLLQATLGFLCMATGSRHVPAAQLTLFSLIEVVLGPTWVWLALGEVPALLTLAGGAIVLGSVVAQALIAMRTERVRA
jgi:drug/metabolite transporter (DMT)-like permease